MSRWSVRPIRHDLEVVLGAPPPAIAAEALARVAAIWRAETAQRPRLFNGRLFSIAREEPERIEGWLAEYWLFLAQRREPALREQLQLRPLGVTGLLRCADGVVFGRRAAHVVQNPGAWELAPSGGIDGSALAADGRIDLARQLLAELAEETGIAPERVSRPPRPFAMVEDRTSGVAAIALSLQTDLRADDIWAAFAALEAREYDELEIVPDAAIGPFVDRIGALLSPASLILLRGSAALRPA